jgi:tRNA A-37 threonylcarbamoyl transferase component Bud32
MDAERYARVRELFLAAEDLPDDQRHEFVSRQAGDDRELIEEVISLLQEHDADNARREGDSAKQPALPPAPPRGQPPSGLRQNPNTPASKRSNSGSTADRSAEPSYSASAEQAPFMPALHDSPASTRSREEFLPKRAGKPEASSGKHTVRHKDPQSTRVAQPDTQRTHASPRYPHERRPQPEKKPSTTPRHRGMQPRGVMLWLFLAAFTPTALVGWWTYDKVTQTLRQAVENELRGVADSVAVSVEHFLDDQARLAESWCRQPSLRDAIIGLNQIPRDEDFVEELKRSTHAKEIRSQLVGLSQNPNIKYVIWDRTGTIIASWLDDGADLGATVAPDGAANLARAMRGETVLYGPELLREEGTGFIPETDRPVMAEIMPVEDESGRIIGAMLIRGFGMFSSFDDVFRKSSESGSFDIYAVNSSGVMVSNSPVASSLRDAGVLQTERPFVALGLRVTDPGVRLTAGETGMAETSRIGSRRIQPLTHAVAGATAGRSGQRTDAYPNYAGIPVVGAWRWIDRWDIGVIVERRAESVYQTANIVGVGFLSAGGLLAGVLLLAARRIAKWIAVAHAVTHPLSRYEIISELGSGGMGLVYRARHSQLGRDTALKVLRGDRHHTEDHLRFDREAKLAASLRNPHTVTIYDYGRSEAGEAYCVMEFLEGLTLYEVVARSGFQNFGRCLYILRQICDSLGEAHQLGLVHRDVKPQNVMLSLDAAVGDWAVVFDFGLAKPLEPDVDSYQTAETIWAGTPMYMAPERYREPNKSDPRSDIYSIGCIAYFLLSGRPPFIECDPESLFALVLTEQPISLDIHRDAAVPEEIVWFVERCMAKRVEDRFQTVGEVAEVLDRLIQSYPWTVNDARNWWRLHGPELMK